MVEQARLESLIEQGAIFYLSHSGGKDSQAMYAALLERIPDEQLVVVHADLGEVEWTGVQDHIRATIKHKLNVVSAIYNDGSAKNLLNMVEKRAIKLAEDGKDAAPWPSSSTRQCTSDLKRGPIEKFIRQDMAARGARLSVNCTGIRSEESSARAKQATWKSNTRLSKAGREVFDWHPIAGWSEQEVFAKIAAVGQLPFWAYQAGNKRLSCVFCILACDNDLRNGFKHRPELALKYVRLERATGYTMFHKTSLSDRLGLIPLKEVAA